MDLILRLCSHLQHWIGLLEKEIFYFIGNFFSSFSFFFWQKKIDQHSFIAIDSQGYTKILRSFQPETSLTTSFGTHGNYTIIVIAQNEQFVKSSISTTIQVQKKTRTIDQVIDEIQFQIG